jgi:hypothetical protein
MANLYCRCWNIYGHVHRTAFPKRTLSRPLGLPTLARPGEEEGRHLGSVPIHRYRWLERDVGRLDKSNALRVQAGRSLWSSDQTRGVTRSDIDGRRLKAKSHAGKSFNHAAPWRDVPALSALPSQILVPERAGA